MSFYAVSKVRCAMCGHEWVAVHECDDDADPDKELVLQALQCPECLEMAGNAISEEEDDPFLPAEKPKIDG